MATVASAARTQPEVQVAPVLYRLSVEQYHAMIDAGVLGKNDKVELLEGLLVCKSMQKPPHPTAIELAREALQPRLPREWSVRTQAPITTKESEPEPDVAVVLGPIRRYRAAHPRPGDIAQVIEVSDTTLAEDRDVKLRIYARARLPVYWIINLVDGQVEVYTEPRRGRDPTYRRRQVFRAGENVPLIIDGQDLGIIPVRDLLP
jgi:Uma2 family endonuclease